MCAYTLFFLAVTVHGFHADASSSQGRFWTPKLWGQTYSPETKGNCWHKFIMWLFFHFLPRSHTCSPEESTWQLRLLGRWRHRALAPLSSYLLTPTHFFPTCHSSVMEKEVNLTSEPFALDRELHVFSPPPWAMRSHTGYSSETSWGNWKVTISIKILVSYPSPSQYNILNKQKINIT